MAFSMIKREDLLFPRKWQRENPGNLNPYRMERDEELEVERMLRHDHEEERSGKVLASLRHILGHRTEDVQPESLWDPDPDEELEVQALVSVDNVSSIIREMLSDYVPDLVEVDDGIESSYVFGEGDLVPLPSEGFDDIYDPDCNLYDFDPDEMSLPQEEATLYGFII